jgi:glycosyltransferase involved in cell wall biosynthesis
MAKILVISPTPSHPQDIGNRARIFALLSELQRLGHKIHFLFLEITGLKSDIKAMEQQWEGFWKITYHLPFSPPLLKKWYDFILRILGGKRVLPYRIDDWFDNSICSPVREISGSLNPNIVMVEYVYLSKIFELFDRSVLKILDTHDVFGGRDQLFLQNNLQPEWFYTSESEEKRGVDRADVILAIQSQEAEYFRKISEKEVLTVGHLIRPAKSAGSTEPIHPPRLLFVGSSNPSNLDGIRWFLENVYGILRKKSTEIELDVIGNIADFIGPAPGVNLIGTVKELTPFYLNASVVINPLQFGTGLKIKTVEALAMKRPLVTTPNGASGIEEWAGRAFLCAETPEEFAAAIQQIITTKELRDSLVKESEEFTVMYNQRTFCPLKKAIDNFLDETQSDSRADNDNSTT